MTINPSNGGVLLEISGNPTDCDADHTAPLVGYVVKTGGGVPWLKPRQAVVYDPTKAVRFGVTEAVVRQQDILAVLEGVYRATCPNGCHENPGSGCPRCPVEKAERGVPAGA